MSHEITYSLLSTQIYHTTDFCLEVFFNNVGTSVAVLKWPSTHIPAWSYSDNFKKKIFGFS